MPEVYFRIRWPDGSTEQCYSPSLVVRDFFDSGVPYPLPDFVERSRAALTEASARVRAKYGFGCTRAAGQLARIERQAAGFGELADACVVVEGFQGC